VSAEGACAAPVTPGPSHPLAFGQLDGDGDELVWQSERLMRPAGRPARSRVGAGSQGRLDYSYAKAAEAAADASFTRSALCVILLAGADPGRRRAQSCAAQAGGETLLGLLPAAYLDPAGAFSRTG
jgi:hypothetical protein